MSLVDSVWPGGGLVDGGSGQQYLYLLMTDAEARLASQVRRHGSWTDERTLPRLRRLRFGSHGDAVRRLQVRLGVAAPDGDFGPDTSVLLHRAQSERWSGRCDGIYSPATDEEFGWRVFKANGGGSHASRFQCHDHEFQCPP
jgi:hypothetical protein